VIIKESHVNEIEKKVAEDGAFNFSREEIDAAVKQPSDEGKAENCEIGAPIEMDERKNKGREEEGEEFSFFSVL